MAQCPSKETLYHPILFPDMNKKIAVTISGELTFDRDSIRKAADMLNKRAGTKNI